MSKLQLFRDFVNERLAAAALEIFGQYEKTLADCQEEICRSGENSTPLQRMLDMDVVIKPEIKLHRTDAQQLSLPENPQIKEEQELWTSQGGEQLQELQSDTADSIFTSPTVKIHYDPEDLYQLPPLDQTPTVENRSTNTTEEQIKAESDAYIMYDYRAAEPASDSQPPSVTPDRPAAQSLEEVEEERGGLLPELTSGCLRLPTGVLISPFKSRTQAKCSRPVPSPCSRPGPCLSIKTSPWTRPIPSYHSGSQSEDVSSGEAESKTVEKPYQCEECDKAFSRKGSLVRHGKIHTGEKPYQSEKCVKGLGQKCSLVKHIGIHTGKKPYQCQECDKAFSHKGTFIRHIRIHTAEKPYQCQECDKAFSKKGNLIIHGRIHTAEKPYQCQECDRAFNQKCNLIRHRRIHTGERPYQCEECDKTFSEQGNLIIHRRIHTGEKPYQCWVCDKLFNDHSNFIKHRRIHTGEKSYQYE